MKKINVCVCADDFGISDEVCEGILNLTEEKRISSISCMVKFESFSKYKDKLKKYNNSVDIGLHLVLTNTHVSDGEKKDKIIFSPFRLFLNSLFARITDELIEFEIISQIEKFNRELGFYPNFIDGHHHVHQYPSINKLLIKIVKKMELEKKNEKIFWIRATHDSFLKIIRRNISIIKSIRISLSGYFLKNNLQKQNIRFNNGFSGIYDFKDEYKLKFENFLKYVNSGHLIMVHPGYVSKKFHLSDKVNESREEEYKFLKSDDYLNLLEKNKCLLAPLSSILKILDNE